MNPVKALLGFFGWIWSKKMFIILVLGSALVFFVALFPFSDLSIAATTMIARATNNNVYAQFESLDVSLLPSPALSGKNVRIETSTFPEVEASYFKIGPSWLNLIANAWTIKNAATGDQDAATKLASKISVHASAEGLMGGDFDIKYGPGTKTEQSPERRQIEAKIDGLKLDDLQKWSDLSFKVQGTASLDTSIQFSPAMNEQPDGEIVLNIKKFEIPAATIQVPFEGAVMPVNIPKLTLDNVELKGRLSNGEFNIESGRFGGARDPLSGRIKGTVGLSFESHGGGQIAPILGRYNLSVELNTTTAIEKSLSFAFILLGNVKTPTPTGAKYVFRAQGTPMAGVPSITRISTF